MIVATTPSSSSEFGPTIAAADAAVAAACIGDFAIVSFYDMKGLET